MNKTDQPSSANRAVKEVLTRISLIAIFVIFAGITFYFAFLRSPDVSETVTDDLTKEPQASYYESIKNSLFKPDVADVNQLSKIQIQEEIGANARRSMQCYSAKYVQQLLLISEIKTGLQNNNNLSDLVNQFGMMNISNVTLRNLVNQLKDTNYTQIDSYYSLKKEFGSVYEQIIASISSVSDNSSWFDQYLSKIIMIRKIGERALKSGGVDSQTAQVKSMLEDGNLIQAVAIINSMPDTQKDIAARWLEKANNMIQIQNIVDSMYDVIISSQHQSNFIMACADD